MRCLSPIWMYDTGTLTPSGKRKLTARPPKFATQLSPIPVRCGKCMACRESKRSEWISRLRMECFSYSQSSFVTLTYRLAPSRLVKKDVQDFVKRLRNAGRDYGISVPCLRYFVVGEYGKRKHRCHWHAIIFGVDFLQPSWKPRLVAFKDGYPIYSSEILERIWSHGFVTVDRANDLNIKYVSKYVTKDNSVSLKSQGIGRSLLVSVSRKSRKTSYRLRPLFVNSLGVGHIHLPDKVKGLSPVGLPSAFDRYLERCDPSLYDSVKASRRDYALSLPFDGRSVADCERTITVFQSADNSKRILDNDS